MSETKKFAYEGFEVRVSKNNAVRYYKLEEKSGKEGKETKRVVIKKNEAAKKIPKDILAQLNLEAEKFKGENPERKSKTAAKEKMGSESGEEEKKEPKEKKKREASYIVKRDAGNSLRFYQVFQNGKNKRIAKDKVPKAKAQELITALEAAEKV